jgi:hypothetical protein
MKHPGAKFVAKQIAIQNHIHIRRARALLAARTRLANQASKRRSKAFYTKEALSK